MKVSAAYNGVRIAFRRYWSTYGGMSYVLTSPFCHAAVLLTLLCTPFWWSGDWWEKSLSVLPSLLGFSIAAFALLLAVGDDKFKVAMGRERSGGSASTLNDLAARFFHFLMIQVLAVLFAFLALGRPATWLVNNVPAFDQATVLGLFLLIATKIFRFSGFFLLSYSLMTALAATLSLFRVATIFSKFVSAQPPGPAAGSGGAVGNAAAHSRAGVQQPSQRDPNDP